MGRVPHENVATVLVDPRVLVDLELDLMRQDMRMWPVRTAPICLDGPRRAYQIRRQLLQRQRCVGRGRRLGPGVDRIRADVAVR